MSEKFEEKTASGYMDDIRAYYLFNGCNHCPFYEAISLCNAVPLECRWTPLINYFLAEEKKECEEAMEDYKR